jgi:hypothetical protein
VIISLTLYVEFKVLFAELRVLKGEISENRSWTCGTKEWRMHRKE